VKLPRGEHIVCNRVTVPQQRPLLAIKNERGNAWVFFLLQLQVLGSIHRSRFHVGDTMTKDSTRISQARQYKS
jgi:hypothetical protein